VEKGAISNSRELRASVIGRLHPPIGVLDVKKG
jgi:hypothetical protein